MNQANALEQLTGLCTEPLASDRRPRAALARAGITESFVFESFRLGYCADQVSVSTLFDGLGSELFDVFPVPVPRCCRESGNRYCLRWQQGGSRRRT